jgi:hypothetical protein
MADNLPPSSAAVTESGSLNFPETSGAHRPVIGLLYMITNVIKMGRDVTYLISIKGLKSLSCCHGRMLYGCEWFFCSRKYLPKILAY